MKTYQELEQLVADILAYMEMTTDVDKAIAQRLAGMIIQYDISILEAAQGYFQELNGKRHRYNLSDRIDIYVNHYKPSHRRLDEWIDYLWDAREMEMELENEFKL